MRNVTRRHRPTPYLLVGGLCGLTWAAGLRGWMAQLVWPASSYTWLTVVLIMLPGLVIGLRPASSQYPPPGSTGGVGFGIEAYAPVEDVEANLRSRGVRVTGVAEDPSPMKQVHDPRHPLADSRGYVTMPNVNVVEEMVNMILAQRAYEANSKVVRASDEMLTQVNNLVR